MEIELHNPDLGSPIRVLVLVKGKKMKQVKDLSAHDFKGDKLPENTFIDYEYRGDGVFKTGNGRVETWKAKNLTDENIFVLNFIWRRYWLIKPTTINRLEKYLIPIIAGIIGAIVRGWIS